MGDSVAIVEKDSDGLTIGQICVADKEYLLNAILFAKASDLNRLFSDILTALRIAKDESTESRVVSMLSDQIVAMGKFGESISELQHKLTQ